MSKFYKIFYGVFFACLVVLPTIAKETKQDNLYWLRYFNRAKITEDFTWENELETRRFFEDNIQNQYLINSRLHYSIAKLTEVAAGFSYFGHDTNDPESPSDLLIREYRGVQEISNTMPLHRKISITGRFRTEQRFIQNNNGIDILEGYNFIFRSRFMLQANYILNSRFADKRTVLKVSNEIFFNADQYNVFDKFDQNRIYIGLEQEINDDFSLELGYMSIYQKTSTPDLYLDRNVVRLTVFHRFSL